MPYDNIISRSDVAALIPEDVASSVLEGTINESFALSQLTRVPMSRAQKRMPVIAALPVAYFVNGDTGLKQTTEVNWDNKYLDAEEIAAIVPIPEAVLDDAEFDAWGSVKPRLEEAIGRALDAAIAFGTNKPSVWPTAVVPAAIAAGNVYNIGTNNAAAGGIVEDQSQAVALAENDGYDPMEGAAARTLKARFRGARSSQGERLGEVTVGKDSAEVDGVSYKFPMRGLWPTGSGAAQAIIWDPAEFMLGVRQDMTYKVLDQAVIQNQAGEIVYNLAQQDMVALRVVSRFAWQVANVINHDNTDEATRYPATVLRNA